MSGIQEWIKVTHAPNSTTVTVTLHRKEDGVTVRWTAKAFMTTLGTGLRDAKKGAYNGLRQIDEAINEMNQEGTS